MTKTPHPINIHVGHRLREVRTLGGFSQAELGDKLDVTQQQIHKYELGVDCINIVNLWKVCNLFNLEIGYFFEGLDREAPDMEYSEGLLKVVRAFCRIEDEDTRQHIYELIKVLGAKEGEKS